MSQSANVRSIDAIKDFRALLCRFGDDAKNALGAVEMEIRRMLDFILQERPAYWTMEIKRRKELLAEAQAELFRRRLQAGPGRQVHDTEQKEQLRKAKMRLEEAEHKLALVRKWAPQVQHAVDEYRGRSRPAGDMLDRELENALALLDRMADALDAYINLAPPSTSAMEPAAASTAPAATTSAPSVAQAEPQAPAAQPMAETQAPTAEAQPEAEAVAPQQEERPPA